jgi:hypothetical protein
MSPLHVDHGIDGDRLGRYAIENFWEINQLTASAIEASGPIVSWRLLIESAKQRFPRLLIPDAIFQDARLAREPFDAVIRDRTLTLLGYLDLYMSDRGPNAAEGATAQGIIKDYFTGDRALFSGESPNNQQEFKKDLTFPDPISNGSTIFAHWHGKISHRFFRLHFEWPVPNENDLLKVVYLGPKITKS